MIKSKRVSIDQSTDWSNQKLPNLYHRHLPRKIKGFADTMFYAKQSKDSSVLGLFKCGTFIIGYNTGNYIFPIKTKLISDEIMKRKLENQHIINKYSNSYFPNFTIIDGHLMQLFEKSKMESQKLCN